MSENTGVLSYGVYLPRYRLDRKLIADANSWFNAGLRGMAKGEKAVANWDEDSITMGVEAARSALRTAGANDVSVVGLASTTHPFADRHNAGVMASALDLNEGTETLDAGGGMRAATTALRLGFDVAAARGESVLISAAEKRKTQAASVQEMRYGDGAGAVVIGKGKPIARLLGASTLSREFISQFRMTGNDYDYAWEERWVRDEGYFKIVPAVVDKALEKAGVKAEDIKHFCLPVAQGRIASSLAKRMGIPGESVADNLQATVGDTGSAHPMLMLAQALDSAAPGDRILLVSFGNGADALVLEATDALPSWREANKVGEGVVKASLARRKPLEAYQKLLAFTDGVALDHGMRAEVDKRVPLTTLARKQGLSLSLFGGKCQKCGTVQYPSDRYCVNPDCNSLDSQDPHRLADTGAEVMTYTADNLTYSPNPPAYYGMIVFEGGGRMMADITDIDTEQLEVGLPVEMTFRIKDVDKQRGFIKYFWKAIPRR